MSNVYDDRPVQESLDGVWTAIVASDASSVSDTVDVLIKAFSLEHRFGPARWPLNGSKLPERGNECLVVFDEKQRPFIMQWYPTDPTPETDAISAVPISACLPYGGDGDPPDDRFVCADGRLLTGRTTTYAAFFSIVGHKYNAGVDPGSNQVRIPDKRGRTSIGEDNMGTAQGAANRITVGNKVHGQNGGAERITLGLTEIASHGHTVNSHDHGGGNHDHPLQVRNIWDAAGSTPLGGVAATHDAGGSGAGGPVKHSGNMIGAQSPGTDSQGGGQSHQNMSPYEVDNWIVRVK